MFGCLLLSTADCAYVDVSVLEIDETPTKLSVNTNNIENPRYFENIKLDNEGYPKCFLDKNIQILATSLAGN